MNCGEDYWKDACAGCAADHAVVTKIHNSFRRELFAPCGSDKASCPVKIGCLAAIWRTTGQTASGKHFVIEDNWKVRGHERRELEELWTGYTEFHIRSAARSFRQNEVYSLYCKVVSDLMPTGRDAA